jgi:type IV pilus assembly protein PilC
MPTFAYTARDESGTSVSGTLMANTLVEATQMLRAERKYPTAVHPAEDGAAAGGGMPDKGIKVARKDVIQFATQLAIMIETGVPISDALDCIGAQAANPKLKQLIEDLSQHVQGGSDFSSALKRHPRSFPRIFTSLIEASEKSGMMSKLLNRATAYMRDEQETVRRVKGALIYPAIMLSFAILTTIFLLAFVLPKFTAIYAAKAAALPTPTKILMNLSNFIVGNWIALIVGTVVLAVGGFFYFRTEGGRRVWHYVQLRIPLLGGMFRKLHLARGLRMVGTMGSAGVNLVDCVTTAQDLCGNTYFRDLWARVSDQIQTGKQLSEPLFQSPLVPRSVAQMISSAEKSGKLAMVMEQIATYSEQELKEKIADLTRCIEPIMIMVMGTIIGGVALALLLPIFTISRVMAH